MKKITLSILFLCSLFLLKSTAQTVEQHIVASVGKYKEINVAKDNKLVKQLSKDSYSKNKPLIDTILKHPNDHNPVVIFAVSSVLFKVGQKDEASFWFYVAQLRTRYDVNRSNDNTVTGTASQLTAMFGPPINEYALKNLDTLKKIVEKVVYFVKNNNENYDERWIDLDGMGAMQAGLGGANNGDNMSKPKESWAAIKSETVKSYYDDFTAYLKSRQK